MIQTMKPLMLETTNGRFINANIVQDARVDQEAGYPTEYKVGFINADGCKQYVDITKESYNLLTDSSAKPSKLDMQV